MRKLYLPLVLVVGLALPASAATPRQKTSMTLKNGATAEESFRAVNDSYTERNADLRDEGFTWDEDRIRFFVSWATAGNYCVHARHEAMSRPMHFSRTVGEPERGPCPSTREARRRWREQMNRVLVRAAIAQEDYATSHDGAYADNMADLRAEGFRNPYEEIKVTPVNVQEGYYCMQAMHRGMDVGQFYDSGEGAPRTGGCPG
jgi:hypothetical protein